MAGACAAAVVLGLAAAASASDAVQVAVTPVTPPSPIITVSGNGVTPGTFAVGNIALDYVFIGTAFPIGEFARFDVNFNIVAGTGRAPVYPVELSLTDIGSPNLNMLATANPLSITGTGWTGSTQVSINIPPSVATDSSLSLDGAEIVGNLKLETPAGSKMDTATSIKVRIRLVHPTSCVRVYNFVTDADLVATYTSINVNVHPINGRIQGTIPGRLSDNLLVVNTCATTQTFDQKVTLDSLFTTAPSNNPGNAVFTYSTAGEIDPNTFLLSSFGTGTPRGQQLCLQNLAISAGTTMLTTVKMDLAAPAGSTSSILPAKFSFTGGLYGAGSGCTGALDALPTPNPVSVLLGWTLK